jgi:hypothetical protein
MKLEAPPGFEPGVEVLQSHPRFPPALFVLAEFSRKSLRIKEIASFWRSPEKCVPLAEIACLRFAAGTISGTARSLATLSDPELAETDAKRASRM